MRAKILGGPHHGEWRENGSHAREWYEPVPGEFFFSIDEPPPKMIDIHRVRYELLQRADGSWWWVLDGKTIPENLEWLERWRDRLHELVER